uniref:Uncharacterized protein n=1 Tax=Mycena chlorophos TaxID=658473 RepID=A0ABQ0L354_MYCCL|nr:predicted protein [Mycena chlorophos]
MQRPAIRQLIDVEFKRLGHDKLPTNQHLNLRCEIAKNMLKGDELLQARLKIEAQQVFDEATAVHKARIEGTPSLDPGEMAEYAFDSSVLFAKLNDYRRARRRMSAVIRPLLDQLARYTGYTLTLFGVFIDDSAAMDIELTCTGANVTSDCPAYMDFTRANPGDYATVGKILTGFAHGIYLRNKYPSKTTVDEDADKATTEMLVEGPDVSASSPNKDNDEVARPDVSASSSNKDSARPDASASSPNKDAARPDGSASSQNGASGLTIASRVFDGWAVRPNQALVDELSHMPAEERRRRITFLSVKPEYEITRANNISLFS